MADVEGTPLSGGPIVSGTSSTTPAPPPCSAPATGTLTAAEVEKLPACACEAGGKAYCAPPDVVAGSVKSLLATCSEGVCLPAKLAGGAAPRTCQSSFGEGRCMNVCVPDVAQNKDLLKQYDCDADERCVPCKNPLKGGASTGVCEIGAPTSSNCEGDAGVAPPADAGAPAPAACPHVGPPVIDPNQFPELDCGSGMRCAPEALVPEAKRPSLNACAGGYCVPEKTIAAGGNYLPKTCVSIGKAEGRCINQNVPSVAKQKGLPRDTCDENELCAPCYSPIDGKDTNACRSVSCDAPKEGVVLFKGCCSKNGTPRGRCVPKALIPEATQGSLGTDGETCTKNEELCAPNENLDSTYVPPACRVNRLILPYTGVCISECIEPGFLKDMIIAKGNCSDGYECAPCKNPLDGKPTGLTGCPQ